MRITYTARRSLLVSHAEGNQYTLMPRTQDIVPSRTPKVEQAESMDGTLETLRYHAIQRYNVTLQPYGGTALASVIEFLDSCEGGEPFTFDPYGTLDDPLSPVTATLSPDGYTQQRHTRKGQGGATDLFVLSFNVRVKT